MRKILILLTLSALLFGCASKLNPRLRFDSRDGMRAGVIKFAPVGTKLSEARKMMENAGFECEYVEMGSFTEGRDSFLADREYEKVENVNFLKCSRSERSGILTGRYWNVAIVMDEFDCVQRVLVYLYNDGP